MTRYHPPKIWMHCESSRNLAPALALANHFARAEEPFAVVLTCAKDLLEDAKARCAETVELHAAPAETAAATKPFVDALSAKALIWFGALRPALIAAVTKAGLPAIAVNLAVVDLAARGVVWRVRATRSPYDAFSKIMVADGTTSARLQRLGVSVENIEITGPMYEDCPAPPGDLNELTVMAEAVGSRPSWYAVSIVPGEAAQIAQAHKAASRRGYRLLLIATPRDTSSGADLGERFRAAGLRVGVRSAGDEPLEDVQAYVADIPGEQGLWYRLAPLTFLGGTLSGPDGPSPFEAASVGSAVLHGPFAKPWGEQYTRLANSGASRKVRSGAELGAALGELIGPDRTAAMAHAGWEEVTRSAPLFDRLYDLAEAAVFEGAFP